MGGQTSSQPRRAAHSRVRVTPIIMTPSTATLGANNSMRAASALAMDGRVGTVGTVDRTNALDEAKQIETAMAESDDIKGCSDVIRRQHLPKPVMGAFYGTHKS